MSVMSVELVYSERRQQVLMINNFKFVRRYKIKNGIKWSCERRQQGCKAQCCTKGESVELMEHNNLNHNHEANQKKYSKQALKNLCKRKATDDLFEKPGKIMRTEIASSSASEHIGMRDICLIRKVMWTARKQHLSLLPRNIDEAQEAIASIPLTTERGEEFLLENDRESKIVIFGCSSNVQVLKESETIYLDGTFQYCCSFFKQLFTIFAVINKHYIPLLFCILPDKKERTYETLFGKVKCILDTGNLKRIIADFEIDIHNAVKSTWPEVRILGCRFHLTQNWYREIQNLGLETVYKNQKEDQNLAHESKWLQDIFGLPHLRYREVSASFAGDFISELPANREIWKFAEYLLVTYISEDALFPPAMWASFSSEPSISNPCESFHSHFNKMFNQAQTDVFSFTRQLINAQTFVCIQMQSTKKRPAGSTAFKERRLQLLDAKQKYLCKAITRKENVASASSASTV